MAGSSCWLGGRPGECAYESCGPLAARAAQTARPGEVLDVGLQLGAAAEQERAGVRVRVRAELPSLLPGAEYLVHGVDGQLRAGPGFAVALLRTAEKITVGDGPRDERQRGAVEADRPA